MANVRLGWTNNEPDAEVVRVQKKSLQTGEVFVTVVDLPPDADELLYEGVETGVVEYRVGPAKGSSYAPSAPVAVEVLAPPTNLTAVVEY